jgi:hypothetical protein
MLGALWRFTGTMRPSVSARTSSALSASSIPGVGSRPPVALAVIKPIRHIEKPVVSTASAYVGMKLELASEMFLGSPVAKSHRLLKKIG